MRRRGAGGAHAPARDCREGLSARSHHAPRAAPPASPSPPKPAILPPPRSPPPPSPPHPAFVPSVGHSSRRGIRPPPPAAAACVGLGFGRSRAPRCATAPGVPRARCGGGAPARRLVQQQRVLCWGGGGREGGREGWQGGSRRPVGDGGSFGGRPRFGWISAVERNRDTHPGNASACGVGSARVWFGGGCGQPRGWRGRDGSGRGVAGLSAGDCV